MKKALFVVILGMVLLLAGCFQSHRIINVNKDGSGTIVEMFLLSSELGKKPGGESTYHDVEQLKSDASKYGEGVKYVSSKAVHKNSLKGYEVTYSFPDIEKLTIAEDAAGEMMDMGMGSSVQDNLSFKFHKGKKAKLEIIFPKEEMEETPEDMEWEDEEMEEITDEEQQQAMQMAQTLYADMEVSTKIVVNGTITDSDADHINGNEIILQEIIFAELMKDEKSVLLMKKMEEMQPTQMENMMMDFPGVKAETKDKVTLEFK
ncbi:MAG: hypothetical protein K9N09_02990 [Candidatus Cloacimonetes bacterium]|nr:hypothetical protein [Candidatus Cloacimonadota bacterium]MCF7813194.1 hypothetical protein [Candidatus Cloacimonadota bacterium]MCF7867642.1 hypothetical protein [Candidatus Cloacimonadota bacterium]MCF7883083.1 hypothetical protein [Candidatus Cloacimonadota bacterium]